MKVSIQEAYKIQEMLKKKIVLENRNLSIKKVAGVDVGFPENKAIASVCIFNFPKLDLIEVKTAAEKISFPYVPGLLAFREGPAILKAFGKIKNKPDLILFDGQGICHPRRMGIATHMGIILNIPSIGCAKSHLYGVYKMPANKKGSFTLIYDEKEVLGAVLRTRKDVKPVFVSSGYKIGLKQSIDLVLKLCPKYRIPEPLRCAHNKAGDYNFSNSVIPPGISVPSGTP